MGERLARLKINKLVGLCKQKYYFDYLREGGVVKNFMRTNDEVEKMAFLEEKHRKYILNNILIEVQALKNDPVDKRRTVMNDWKVKYDELQ
jgi:hypothetical protein